MPRPSAAVLLLQGTIPGDWRQQWHRTPLDFGPASWGASQGRPALLQPCARPLAQSSSTRQASAWRPSGPFSAPLFNWDVSCLGGRRFCQVEQGRVSASVEQTEIPLVDAPAWVDRGGRQHVAAFPPYVDPFLVALPHAALD